MGKFYYEMNLEIAQNDSIAQKKCYSEYFIIVNW